MEHVHDIDIDFAKLAALGITIVVASGDGGAGYTPPVAQCNPLPSAHKGKGFIGKVVGNYSVQSPLDCCQAAGTSPIVLRQ